MHPAIASGDFGKIVALKSQHSLSEHEKYLALKKHFKFRQKVMISPTVQLTENSAN